MLLYHGTSEYSAMEAMKTGLKPRSLTGLTNWSEIAESNPNAVYLTDTWACHYAINSKMQGTRMIGQNGQLSNRIAVIEIDTKGLLFSNFRADEDYLAHTDPSVLSLVEKTKKHRGLTSYDWKASLSGLGVCAYYGSIPARNITRVALFDHRTNRDMMVAMADGLINPVAFKYCGQWHRNYMRWLFGEKVQPSDIGNIMDIEPIKTEMETSWNEILSNRSGIEIIGRKECICQN